MGESANEQIGRQLRAAMHRKQDEDWERWTPKQRERARKNGEYYGEDRPFWMREPR